jgi:FkbM family methyltransferase
MGTVVLKRVSLEHPWQANLRAVVVQTPPIVTLPEPFLAMQQNQHSGPVTRAEATVGVGAEPPGPSRFGRLGTLVRAALLRALRPYTAGEARIDRALLDAISDLDARLRAIEAAMGLSNASAPADSVSSATPAWIEQVARDEQNMRSLIATALQPDSNCIDIGAHAGAVLEEIVKAAPRGHHIAFEPIPELCVGLRKRFPQVEVRCAAVSSHRGSASFAYVRDVPEWSGLKLRALPDGTEPRAEQIEVCLEALDEVLPKSYRPSLVKIDVEGAEEAVLKGAMQTLRRHHPIVLFEHGVGSANELLADELGYEIYDLDGAGPYTREEFERVFWANEKVNFVAR